jgi:DNA-binding transcriptional LysR family regulator
MTPLEQVSRRLKLRDLQLFEAVARSGSIAKAAKHLNLTQSAASKAMAQLERAAGVRLLDRSTQGVEPTPYGRVLLDRSVAIFDELRQGMKEIEFLTDPTVGEVRIGTGEGMPPGLISAVIDRLLRQYPRFTFRVIQAATNDLQYRDLRERNVDLIFGRLTPSVTEKDLDVEILFNDPFLVVAGLNSKWLRRRRVEPAELIDEPWCLFDRHEFLLSVAKAFRAKGLEMPCRTIITNSVQLSFAMAATGNVLTVASASRLRLAGDRLGVRPIRIKLTLESFPTGIVTLKNRSIAPAAQRFIDFARIVAKAFSRRSSTSGEPTPK